MYYLDIITTILGLLYILLEYRASILLWYVGVVMPALDIYLYWQHGLYGDSLLAIYYLFAAIYGYWQWKRGSAECRVQSAESPLVQSAECRVQSATAQPNSALCTLHSALIFFLLWSATYFLLVTFTNSTVPALDALTNALSIIAMWLLAKKCIYHWFCWIVVDAISSYLYIIKDLPFKAGLYALYVAIAVAGYYRWKKLALS